MRIKVNDAFSVKFGKYDFVIENENGTYGNDAYYVEMTLMKHETPNTTTQFCLPQIIYEVN